MARVIAPPLSPASPLVIHCMTLGFPSAKHLTSVFPLRTTAGTTSSRKASLISSLQSVFLFRAPSAPVPLLISLGYICLFTSPSPSLDQKLLEDEDII